MTYLTIEQQTAAIQKLEDATAITIAIGAYDNLPIIEELSDEVGFALDSFTNDFLSDCNDSAPTVQQATAWF